MTKYTVEAAHTQEAVEEGQCDYVLNADTLKEAKVKAKELGQSMGYVRIIEHTSRICVADYFRK